jgi:hypothetical protein
MGQPPKQWRDTMFDLPADTVERLEEILPTAFYAVMGLALFVALLGAAGPALFVLIIGAAVHVARVGVEARHRGSRSLRPSSQRLFDQPLRPPR